MVALLDRPRSIAPRRAPLPPAPTPDVHEMHVGDPERHFTITWQKGNAHAVALASRVFALRKEWGYLAYRTTGPEEHEVIREFDADAETIVLCSPMAGG